MRVIILALVICQFWLGAVEPPLRVGMELNYPPFEMVCPDGQPCGISVDIARELGKALQRDIVFENISFVGLIPALNTGKVDLVISSLTITDQRRKAIDFSIPYATTGLCLLLSLRSPIQTIEEANQPGRIIVVKSGTSGELYAMRHLNKAKVRVLEKEAMCVLEVVQGKADGFIYDQLSVYTQWQKNPTTTRALLTPFQKEEWGIGIKKGDSLLLGKINQFISDFKAKGGFDQLADRYLPEQKAAFQKMGVPFVF